MRYIYTPILPKDSKTIFSILLLDIFWAMPFSKDQWWRLVLQEGKGSFTSFSNRCCSCHKVSCITSSKPSFKVPHDQRFDMAPPTLPVPAFASCEVTTVRRKTRFQGGWINGDNCEVSFDLRYWEYSHFFPLPQDTNRQLGSMWWKNHMHDRISKFGLALERQKNTFDGIWENLVFAYGELWVVYG